MLILSDDRCACSRRLSLAVRLQESKPQGKLSEVWAPALEASGVAQADVSAALSELLAPKDAADIQKAKKAAFLAASVMQKRAVPELESRLAQAPAIHGEQSSPWCPWFSCLVSNGRQACGQSGCLLPIYNLELVEVDRDTLGQDSCMLGDNVLCVCCSHRGLGKEGEAHQDGGDDRGGGHKP